MSSLSDGVRADRLQCSARDFEVLVAGAGADADGADAVAVDEDGETSLQIGETLAGGEPELDLILGVEARGGLTSI